MWSPSPLNTRNNYNLEASNSLTRTSCVFDVTQTALLCLSYLENHVCLLPLILSITFYSRRLILTNPPSYSSPIIRLTLQTVTYPLLPCYITALILSVFVDSLVREITHNPNTENKTLKNQRDATITTYYSLH